jgi:hypothetical protein
MRKVPLITLTVLVILAALYTVFWVRASYEYERTVKAEWSLADKSSTIPAKREHVDKFVKTLEDSGLEGKYNALIFPTADNSFDANFAALKTLQQRLHEIEGMDIRSFEYQTAIQQITAQEQGEAKAMLDVFEGVWYLKYHIFMWEYINVIISVFLMLSIAAAALCLVFQFD